jgi:hypothetical protein
MSLFRAHIPKFAALPQEFSCYRINLPALYTAIGEARSLATCFPFVIDQDPFSIQPDALLISRRYLAERSPRARRRWACARFAFQA